MTCVRPGIGLSESGELQLKISIKMDRLGWLGGTVNEMKLLRGFIRFVMALGGPPHYRRLSVPDPEIYH